MSSRALSIRSKFFFLFSLGFFALVGCTPEVGEQPPPPTSFELSATKCFDKAVTDLRLFFTAEVADQNLVQAWGCLETAFIQFEKYIQSEDPRGYTSQEIVTFIENYFLEDVRPRNRTISPALQVELMKLKRIFIGGSTAFVTREELRTSLAFLQRMSQLTRALNPFMKIIALNWKPDIKTEKPEEMKFFEEANSAFQVFARGIAEIIKSHDGDYRLNDAIKLIREVELYFGEDWDWVEDIEKALPGVKKLKVTLAGGDEDLITNREWVPVLILGARGYFQFLRYHYFIKETPQTGSGVRLVYVARTLEDIFSIFQDLLAQRPNQAVNRKEIYEIVKAFEELWEDLKVSEKLVFEFMKIKRALIGGDTERWTVQDFENARRKVPELRKIIEKFLPYFNIYAFDWDPSFESEEQSRRIFKESSKRLQVVAVDVGKFLESEYSFDDLLALLEEIETLYPDTEDPNREARRPSVTMKRYRPLFLEVNSALFGRGDTIVSKDTWGRLLPLVAGFYSVYQYYDYFMADKSFKHSLTIRDLGVMVDDGMILASRVLEQKKGQRFSQDELVKISVAMSKASFLPEAIQQSTYQSLWTAILQHFLFDPQRRLRGEKNSWLGQEQLDILAREFNNWKVTQLALNDIFDQRFVLSFKPNEMLKILKDLVDQSGGDPVLRSGLGEVYRHLDSTVTKTLDAENQLQISNKVIWNYERNALFQANLSRLMARLLIQSFSNEKELSRVSECEAQGAFKLLVDAFRDMRIFDPSDTFISSRFLEANIFMPKGNGDKFMDLFELGDLVTVIFSGLKVNDKLESSIRNQCQIHKDGKGKEFVLFSCMSEHHYVAARKYMPQMPEFKSYLDRLASGDRNVDPQNEFQDIRGRPGFGKWNQVFRETLKATGWKPNRGYGAIKQESVYLSEGLYYPFVVHYMELLYSRFDSTKNNILQTSEARRAFPTFRPLLRDLAKEQIQSGLLKESDLLAVFTFILRYQEEPGLSNIFRWLTWKSFPDRWDVWVGRTQMAQILGYIADRASSLNNSQGGGSSGGGQCSAAGGSVRPPRSEPEPPEEPSVPDPQPDEPLPEDPDETPPDDGFPDFPEGLGPVWADPQAN